jgi:hypothetical protein
MLAAFFRFSVSDAWILLALFVAMFVVAEIGYRLGRSRKGVGAGEARFDAVQGALLALVSLLLAFGVSFAQSRFEARVHHMLHETNAIHTAYQRSELASHAISDGLKMRIEQFLNARIEFYTHPVDDEGLLQIRRNTDELEDRIWNLTARQVTEIPLQTSANIPLVNAINEMMDARSDEDGMFQIRMPRSVSALLLIFSAIVVGMVAYGYGASATHHWVYSSLLSLVIASTLFVIVDLDRPRIGLIKIPTSPLIRLHQRIRGFTNQRAGVGTSGN